MNFTHKVFWENPYLTEPKTQVSSVSGTEITLESTIFYAFSGGQESDSGTVAGIPVIEARKDQSQIYYRLAENHGLKTGDSVTVLIDWDRRYRLMRLHFAAEIVLELFVKKLPSIEKIGAHIGAEKARIDFRYEENLAVYLPEIQEAAMAIVKSNTPILSCFSHPESERRYWEIPGFARVPCGGTHLRSTGEIGDISLKRDKLGKGKSRIVITCSELLTSELPDIREQQKHF